jgi:hypothetical protein
MMQGIRDDEFSVSPNGLHIGHTQAEVNFLVDVFRRGAFSAFVEIGVHVGGLADIFADVALHYLGLEINEAIVDDLVKRKVSSLPHAEFRFADAWAPLTILDVAMWLQNKRPAFIYCDGGDKPKELHLYAPVARPGDVIAVHDYGTYDRAEISPTRAEGILKNRGFVHFQPFHGEAENVRIAMWRR